MGARPEVALAWTPSASVTQRAMLHNRLPLVARVDTLPVYVPNAHARCRTLECMAYAAQPVDAICAVSLCLVVPSWTQRMQNSCTQPCSRCCSADRKKQCYLCHPPAACGPLLPGIAAGHPENLRGVPRNVPQPDTRRRQAGTTRSLYVASACTQSRTSEVLHAGRANLPAA